MDYQFFVCLFLNYNILAVLKRVVFWLLLVLPVNNEIHFIIFPYFLASLCCYSTGFNFLLFNRTVQCNSGKKGARSKPVLVWKRKKRRGRE